MKAQFFSSFPNLTVAHNIVLSTEWEAHVISRAYFRVQNEVELVSLVGRGGTGLFSEARWRFSPDLKLPITLEREQVREAIAAKIQRATDIPRSERGVLIETLTELCMTLFRNHKAILLDAVERMNDPEVTRRMKIQLS